jgi:hypothetical protein
LAKIEMEDALAILRALDAGARSMRDDGRCVKVLPKAKSVETSPDSETSAPDW